MHAIDGMSLFHLGQYDASFTNLYGVVHHHSMIWQPMTDASITLDITTWIHRYRPLIWLRLAQCCVYQYHNHGDTNVWNSNRQDYDVTATMSSSYAAVCLQRALESLRMIYHDHHDDNNNNNDNDSGSDTDKKTIRVPSVSMDTMTSDDRQYYSDMRHHIWLTQSYVALSSAPSSPSYDASLALSAANRVMASSLPTSSMYQCAQSYAADALCIMGKFEQVHYHIYDRIIPYHTILRMNGVWMV